MALPEVPPLLLLFLATSMAFRMQPNVTLVPCDFRRRTTLCVAMQQNLVTFVVVVMASAVPCAGPNLRSALVEPSYPCLGWYRPTGDGHKLSRACLRWWKRPHLFLELQR